MDTYTDWLARLLDIVKTSTDFDIYGVNAWCEQIPRAPSGWTQFLVCDASVGLTYSWSVCCFHPLNYSLVHVVRRNSRHFGSRLNDTSQFGHAWLCFTAVEIFTLCLCLRVRHFFQWAQYKFDTLLTCLLLRVGIYVYTLDMTICFRSFVFSSRSMRILHR